MTATTQQRRSPLGLFPDKPTPRLYDRIIEVLRVRHYSLRTEDTYLHWIRRYIELHKHKHPRRLVEGDVNRFLTDLALNGHVAASSPARIHPIEGNFRSGPSSAYHETSDGSYIPSLVRNPSDRGGL